MYLSKDILKNEYKEIYIENPPNICGEKKKQKTNSEKKNIY